MTHEEMVSLWKEIKSIVNSNDPSDRKRLLEAEEELAESLGEDALRLNDEKILMELEGRFYEINLR